MKPKYLVQYAAVITGLFLDVFSAGVLGLFSELEIVGVAFLATLLFIIGYIGTLFTVDLLTARAQRGQTGHRKAEGKQKKHSTQKGIWRAIKRHLPYPIWHWFAYREWKARKRREASRRSEPQIYTLSGSFEEIRSHDDRDMMQIVPVWTAQKEAP